MIETARYHQMIQSLIDVHGEEVAMTLAECLRTDHLATKADLENLATKADLAVIDARFGKIDARFEKVDDRFGKIDARFEKIDDRFDKIDARFDKIDDRFDQLNKHFYRVFYGMVALIIAAVLQQAAS